MQATYSQREHTLIQTPTFRIEQHCFRAASLLSGNSLNPMEGGHCGRFTAPLLELSFPLPFSKNFFLERRYTFGEIASRQVVIKVLFFPKYHICCALVYVSLTHRDSVRGRSEDL